MFVISCLNIQILGTFYYSWKTKRFRMNRLNSMSNKFCQINGFYSFFRFEWDMYIDNNKRYIFYPENDSCCYCCHSDNGCGMLKPDWGNKAEFLGQIEYQGMSAFKWDVKGIQSNIIIETTEADPKARRLLLIDQQPQDSTKFDYNSYTPYVQEEEIALPEQCNNASTCSLFSFCTLFRWF